MKKSYIIPAVLKACEVRHANVLQSSARSLGYGGSNSIEGAPTSAESKSLDFIDDAEIDDWYE